MHLLKNARPNLRVDVQFKDKGKGCQVDASWSGIAFASLMKTLYWIENYGSDTFENYSHRQCNFPFNEIKIKISYHQILPHSFSLAKGNY